MFDERVGRPLKTAYLLNGKHSNIAHDVIIQLETRKLAVTFPAQTFKRSSELRLFS